MVCGASALPMQYQSRSVSLIWQAVQLQSGLGRKVLSAVPGVFDEGVVVRGFSSSEYTVPVVFERDEPARGSTRRRLGHIADERRKTGQAI